MKFFGNFPIDIRFALQYYYFLSLTSSNQSIRYSLCRLEISIVTINATTQSVLDADFNYEYYET